jgi:hypothetical protein
VTIPIMPDDPRIQSLRQLIDEATALQEQATKLVVEITDQLQRSIWMHPDWGVAEDRPPRRPRRKPSRT